MIVAPEYASILEGVSYVEAIVRPWNVKFIGDLPEAKWTFTYPKTDNWAMDSWAKTGLSRNEWFSRPLRFDRRDRRRERRQFQDPRISGKIAVNWSSQSFSFRRLDELKPLIRSDYLDISEIRAERIFDMLWILERLKGLITVDSALYWLARACHTPVILIGSNDPYYLSPGHEKCRGRYSEDEVFNRIPQLNEAFR